MQTSNKLYKFKEELPLTSGQTLDGFELMVECYGNLNQEKNDEDWDIRVSKARSTNEQIMNREYENYMRSSRRDKN